jgi:hypothetical protein
MVELSYRRHRFPPVVIQHAVWLYLRFTLSYRDVEDLLAERGLDIKNRLIPCSLSIMLAEVAPNAYEGLLQCDPMLIGWAKKSRYYSETSGF